ncbi:MAG: substrate-binding domain-containing protein, partial [Alphaproteobacteria bacterium]
MTMGGRHFRSIMAAVLAALSFLAGPGAGAADQRILTLGTTTTTENSGLMAHLLPIFKRATGIRVRLLVRGTGDVLRAARAGDVDAILAHDKVAELKLVADGFGSERRDVMVNDFIIVGPKDDPVGIAGLRDGAKALARIAGARHRFISRGDDSGTHRAERRLWRAVTIDPTGDSGKWYLEAGAGMGAT